MNITSPIDPDIANASSWFDVVEIELDYDERAIEIDRLRIFDHRKRELLGEDQPIGWRLVDPHRIQVYGFRTLVPDLIDIWFDINRLVENEKVYSMTPQIGSQLDLPGGTLKITDLREGHLGWIGSQSEGSRFVEDTSRKDIDPAMPPLRGGRNNTTSSTHEPKGSHAIYSREFLFAPDAVKDYRIELMPRR